MPLRASPQIGQTGGPADGRRAFCGAPDMYVGCRGGVAWVHAVSDLGFWTV